MEIINTSNSKIELFDENPLIASSIRLTKKCNAFCRHCYGSSGKAFEDELSTKEIKNLIDQYSDMGVTKLFFTGGEPFTRTDITELIQYADFKEMDILISTNGSLLTKELLKEISHIPFNMFQVSLDGGKEVHDKIRGEGFYSKALNSLELLNELSFNNITIATCLMKQNFDQISNVLDVVMYYKVPIYSLVLLLVAGKADKSIDVSSQELKYAIEQLFSIYRQNEGKFRLAENSIIPPALVPPDLRQKGVHKPFEVCCAFPNIAGVEANGNIAPCDGFFTFKEMMAGNIRESSVNDIWNNSSVFKSLLNLDVTNIEGVCGKCTFLQSCAGSCRASSYSYYGNFNAPFPTCQKLYDDGLFPNDCLREAVSTI